MLEPTGVGRFMNVDVELELGAADTAILATAFGSAVDWLGRPPGRACFELGGVQLATADATIDALLILVRAVPPSARAAWDRATHRVFDVGIEAAAHPPDDLRVGGQTLAAIGSVGAELAVTVYAASEPVDEPTR